MGIRGKNGQRPWECIFQVSHVALENLYYVVSNLMQQPDRFPVILLEDQSTRWLDRTLELQSAWSLCGFKHHKWWNQVSTFSTIGPSSLGYRSLLASASRERAIHGNLSYQEQHTSSFNYAWRGLTFLRKETGTTWGRWGFGHRGVKGQYLRKGQKQWWFIRLRYQARDILF